MSLTKLISSVAFLVFCVGLSWGQERVAASIPPPNTDSIEFTGSTPKAGGNKGEIATTIDWKGPQLGLDKAEISLYETVGGVKTKLDSKDTKVTKSPGTWAYQFTGLASGKVVTSAYARTIDVSGNTIVDKTLTGLSVTIP